MRQTYKVIVDYEDGGWVLTFPALGPGATEAKRLDLAERMARSYISLLTETDADSFDVDIEPRLLGEWGELLANIQTAKQTALEAQDAAAASSRQAVAALTAEGLPMRDIGAILGISYQRVAQLKSTTFTGLTGVERGGPHRAAVGSVPNVAAASDVKAIKRDATP